ncbi:MAG: hypothetical protein F4X56_07225 [Gammaproteobacteria bacterium]|nr:hypothetical protein [Gammaproteobacteria bacterium]
MICASGTGFDVGAGSRKGEHRGRIYPGLSALQQDNPRGAVGRAIVEGNRTKAIRHLRWNGWDPNS